MCSHANQFTAQMMLLDNLIHSDLHPGNILVRLMPPGSLMGALYGGLEGVKRSRYVSAQATCSAATAGACPRAYAHARTHMSCCARTRGCMLPLSHACLSDAAAHSAAEGTRHCWA